MADEWGNDTTEEEVDVVEEIPAFKAPSTWRSKAPTLDKGDSVQVEFLGSGSYSILGYSFSHENRTQSVPSNIASLVLATGKFK
jgi:hypothetical protein